MNLKEAENIFEININNENLNSLKEKYYSLIKLNHPDKNGSTKQCAKINVAFKILNDHLKLFTINNFLNQQKEINIQKFNYKDSGPDFIIETLIFTTIK